MSSNETKVDEMKEKMGQDNQPKETLKQDNQPTMGQGNRGKGQPAEAEEPDVLGPHMEMYRWPPTKEDFDRRNVVVIGVDGSREASYAFNWYMHNMYREGDVVMLVHAMQIGQNPRPGLVSKEAWNKEIDRIHKFRLELHTSYRGVFFDRGVAVQMIGAIISRQGESGDLIVNEAKKVGAHCIIIGKRNQDANMHHHVVTKSTTDFVVCNASCPVLVCKAVSKPSPKAETSSSAPYPYQRDKQN